MSKERKKASYFFYSMVADSNHLVLYDISYNYFGLIGFLVTLISGMVISIVAGRMLSFQNIK